MKLDRKKELAAKALRVGKGRIVEVFSSEYVRILEITEKGLEKLNLSSINSDVQVELPKENKKQELTIEDYELSMEVER